MIGKSEKKKILSLFIFQILCQPTGWYKISQCHLLPNVIKWFDTVNSEKKFNGVHRYEKLPGSNNVIYTSMYL